MKGARTSSIISEPIDNGLKKTPVYKQGTQEYTDYTDNEIKAYGEHINTVIPKDVMIDLKKCIYRQLRDGIVLAHLIEHLKKSVININSIISPVDMNKQNGLFEATANLSKVFFSAKKIGIVTVNIGPEDILFENRGLVLGLLWQMVKMSVTNVSNIRNRPELVNLLYENENLNDITNGHMDDILLRWVNYHLKNAFESEFVKEIRKVYHEKVKIISSDSSEDDKIDSFEEIIPTKCNNFGTDLKDSKIYLLVLKQVSGTLVDKLKFYDAYFSESNYQRAEKTLEIAEFLGCKKFVKAEDIVCGDSRLNFLFMSTICNIHFGIEKTSKMQIEEMIRKIEELTRCNKEMQKEVEELSFENEQLKGNRYNSSDIEEIHKKNIEARREIYEQALKEYNISFEEFSCDILKKASDLGYKLHADGEIKPKERILYVINALLNEIEKLNIENKELSLRNEIINEVYIKLEVKIEEMLEAKRNERRGILDLFCCKK